MIDGDCLQLLVTIVVEHCHGLQFDASVVVPVFFHVGDDVSPGEDRQYLELILKPKRIITLYKEYSPIKKYSST